MSQKEFKLTIELVPSTVWRSSIYRIYKKDNLLNEWKQIKEKILLKEGCRCWVCGSEGRRLEAHEFWEYDDKNRIQKLAAIHHLCSACHRIKHIGFWRHTADGREQLEKSGLTQEDLVKHFCKTNKCSIEEFEAHEREALRIWKERSSHDWKQDFGQHDPQGRTK